MLKSSLFCAVSSAGLEEFILFEAVQSRTKSENATEGWETELEVETVAEATFQQGANGEHEYSGSDQFFEQLNGTLQSLFDSSAVAASPLMAFILLGLAAILAVCILVHPLKAWWLNYNMKSAVDPDSKLNHLPIPPGSFGLPFIGETLAWITQGPKFNSNRRKKYGNVFTTNAISLPIVKVSGHEYVKEILTGEHDKVTTIWPYTVRTILGSHGIVNSIGDIHKYKRKVAFKAFTRAALNDYVPIMRNHATRIVRQMQESDQPLVYPNMLRLTFDVAVNALLGLEISDQVELDMLFKTFHQLVSNVFCLPYNVPGFGFNKGMKARNQLLDLLQIHIEAKKQAVFSEINKSGEGADPCDGLAFRGALGTILYEEIKNSIRLKKLREESNLDNNNTKSDADNEFELGDLEIKEIAIELMFAGYYTSASALTSAILELARHPDVFSKLENELLQHGILREDSSDEEHMPELNLQNIHKLTYLDQVLKETLRIRPPVLGAYRRAKKTFQIGDYRIPKGWTVIYNIRDTHELEFEHMTEFDPEHFAPDANDKKFRFIPFGGGPRVCIGQEYARIIMKVSLIEMIRCNSSWKLANKTLPKMVAIPTLHPKDGLPVHLQPRKTVGVVTSRSEPVATDSS
uniref:cytochrome P450 26B1 isoform X2 n=1 Tax=Ciona intestinalis TaxID=7719 RepID=UPI0005213A95|nr:cytochrome P450 26B1 isoform X2 [Ciona intestinalis]|eukprot:XP_009859215.1 cytochrome P450 26B1 isoform X2 [Ciona intestinalis]